MRHNKILSAFLIPVCLAVIGCSESAVPTAPNGSRALATVSSSNVDLPAGPNDLKASVPVMVGPAAGATVGGSQLVLQATNSVSTHVAVPLDIEFEVWEVSNDSARFLASRRMAQDGSGITSWAPNVSLARGAEHRARARGWYESSAGAWSAPVVFTGQSFVGLDEIDAFDVTYLHTPIADWPQTSVITGITMGPSQICVFHTGANRFPQSQYGEIIVEGNLWVFAPINGRWYGATWDWVRPGQQCKGENKYQLGPDQIRIPPMNTWIPASGSPICFAVSARARDGVPAGRERSNIACTTTSP